ncbi:MgtC/SapB family protein [Candidatus Gracilibacteria bacterium]|nr:MgtC/SapB family protein [Candidatus Gracilibacteria bacterium]
MEILSNAEIVIRLMVTLAICIALGIERELKSQPAGLRTHVLIGVGSCLIMIISILVPEIYNSNINDPGRIAAQVVSGVGFLGAGAIMKQGFDTKGLTTAANIWVTAAIGLAVGAGLYTPALFTAGIILANLVIITKVKSRYLHPKKYCSIHIIFETKQKSLENIYEQIKLEPIKIISKNIKETDSGVTLDIVSRIDYDTNLFTLKANIERITKAKKISISENMRY